MSDTFKLVYTDTFEHAFDEKGRITVPKEWRGDGFETRLYVMPPEPGCLKVYPGSWLAAKMKTLESASIADPNRKSFEELASRIQSVELDPQHRISIKDRIRQAAGLQKNAVLAGRFDHFEIWSPEKWKRDASGPLTMESVLKGAGL
ncbi:MAG: division/cell wall cluster transcriptional repressor MraZ [Methylacidiphilales bacterium]|nr:division/cell wall cluster transcriptional repressor MraZ [Candidatus Methylacidiphilales bacterium]